LGKDENHVVAVALKGMPTNPVFEIRIWEQIRSGVELKTDTLLEEIRREISGDLSLHDYQGLYPVPWQMGAVMQQRAESWIQRVYDLCCAAYQSIGKEVSAEFDRAVWGYWIEPFIMREEQTTAEGWQASKLFELLLCAVGSPPENRRHLKVGQKDCCLKVRNEILLSWQKKLLDLTAKLDEPTRGGRRTITTQREAHNTRASGPRSDGCFNPVAEKRFHGSPSARGF
jgi:hypothetical protein